MQTFYIQFTVIIFNFYEFDKYKFATVCIYLIIKPSVDVKLYSVKLSKDLNVSLSLYSEIIRSHLK